MKYSRWIFVLILFTNCTVQKKLALTENTKLHFLGEYDVPHKSLFKQTAIGGLSGIDYDFKNDLFYLICDDRSAINPARFYTAKIFLNEKGIDSVQFVNVTTLLQKTGEPYPNSKQNPLHTPDPEALRYNAKTKNWLWTSEGERIIQKERTVIADPAITLIDKGGKFIDSFALPANMHMRSTTNGPRQNGVFEGLTFADNYKSAYVNVEEPIYEDGPRAGLNDSTGWIRITKYNVASKKPVAQYAYQIDPVAEPAIPSGAFKINGVPDILWMGNDKLLVIERSFSTGHKACVIKIYLADLSSAADISSVTSLQAQPPKKPIAKKLLVNMNSLGIYIDNIEGVTLGPKLSNGHQALIFVADDNFDPEEKTQFLLFEIE